MCLGVHPTLHQQYLTTLHHTKSKNKNIFRYTNAKKKVTSYTSFKCYFKVLSIKNEKTVVFQEIGNPTSQEEVREGRESGEGSSQDILCAPG